MTREPRRIHFRKAAVLPALAVCGLTIFLPIRAAAETTGASFLKIGGGARAAGMGSAYTAMSGDAESLSWNPAGLAGLAQRQASLLHVQWVGDIRYDSAVYAHPAGRGAWAGGVSVLSQGALEGRGENREKREDFAARDGAVSLSFSRPLSARFAFGAGLKGVEQRIGSDKARGWAFDAGLHGRLGRGLSVGVSALNFGPRMRFIEERYRLPAAAAAGLNYAPAGGLSLALDVKRCVYEGRTSVGAGAEYKLLDRVAVRTGYLAQRGARSSGFSSSEKSVSRLGSLEGVNLGLGLRLGGWGVDYAMSPAGELGDAHRLSLSVHF
ncbi:MAG: PorV/PorQ family protein [Elusimicrobiota bacterium]